MHLGPSLARALSLYFSRRENGSCADREAIGVGPSVSLAARPSTRGPPPPVTGATAQWDTGLSASGERSVSRVARAGAEVFERTIGRENDDDARVATHARVVEPLDPSARASMIRARHRLPPVRAALTLPLAVKPRRASRRLASDRADDESRGGRDVRARRRRSQLDQTQRSTATYVGGGGDTSGARRSLSRFPVRRVA